MPFCPKCRYEYVEEIDVCCDCGEKLLDKLPDEINCSEIKVKWKPLQTLPGRIYAEMVKEVFDKKGIPSLVRSTFFHPHMEHEVSPEIQLLYLSQKTDSKNVKKSLLRCSIIYNFIILIINFCFLI